MNNFETIHELKAELADDVQEYARLAARDFFDKALEAEGAEEQEFNSKAERAWASYWIARAEYWAGAAEQAREFTYQAAALSELRAREHEAEAEHCATKAEIAFDRSNYHRAEAEQLRGEAE